MLDTIKLIGWSGRHVCPQLLVMYTLFTKHWSNSCWFPTTIRSIILDCLATEEIDVFSVRWTDDIPGDCRTLHPRRSVSLYRLRHTSSRHVLRFLRSLFRELKRNYVSFSFFKKWNLTEFSKILPDDIRLRSAWLFPFSLYWGLQCEKKTWSLTRWINYFRWGSFLFCDKKFVLHYYEKHTNSSVFVHIFINVTIACALLLLRFAISCLEISEHTKKFCKGKLFATKHNKDFQRCISFVWNEIFMKSWFSKKPENYT